MSLGAGREEASMGRSCLGNGSAMPSLRPPRARGSPLENQSFDDEVGVAEDRFAGIEKRPGAAELLRQTRIRVGRRKINLQGRRQTAAFPGNGADRAVPVRAGDVEGAAVDPFEVLERRPDAETLRRLPVGAGDDDLF